MVRKPPELLRFWLMVIRIGQNVRDMNQAAFEGNTSDQRISTGRE